MYYFVYHINTIALSWEEKPTSLLNENKWIDNPRITVVECVGANSSDGKMRWIMIVKTTMVVIFNLQNSHLLTDRRSLSGKRPKSACGKFSSFRFSFSGERNANTKATEYITFGFSFSILVFFAFWESLKFTVCQRYGFFSVSAAIVRESSDKQLVFRILKALPLLHQPDRVAPKWLVSSWLAISTHVKKYDVFTMKYEDTT